jgi:hypothetical protein
MSTVQFGYRPTGVQTSKDGITVPYRLIGITDRDEAYAYASNNAPASLGAFYLRDVRLTGTAPGMWDVDAEFADWDKQKPFANQHSWTFDTTGKTKHVTQAIQHIATYTIPGRTAIEHKGAIGVTDDSVEGTDVPARCFKWTETWMLPKDRYGFTFSSILGDLTGCMNPVYFRGFPAYTVAFGGGTGGKLNSEGTLREFNFSFEVSPSESGLIVGEITGIDKAGWDYLWVRYRTADDATAKKTTPQPIQVEVDRVLRVMPFTLLGIGTGMID